MEKQNFIASSKYLAIKLSCHIGRLVYIINYYIKYNIYSKYNIIQYVPI